VAAPQPDSVDAASLIRNMVLLGIVGLASGILTWLVISFVWEALIGLDSSLSLAGWELSFSHLTLVPGFVFGNAVGLALARFGLVGLGRALAYIAAATVSNFIATNFAANLVDAIESASVLGMAAGLLGAACLTILSLAILPFTRQLWPCLSMLAAGAALGALLHVAIEDSSGWGQGFLILYALWQAGYGAALGMALPGRSAA
jgi:hypothetical protein